MPDEATTAIAKSLLNLLTLAEETPDVWVGAATPDDHRVPTGRVFGGQVVAQAMLAAEASVPDVQDRPPGSFHCRFLRPGDVAKPINYRVARDSDGRSFSHRRVEADQGDKPILTASIMFHRREEEVSHQIPMPPVPGPEELIAGLVATRDGGGPLAEMARGFLSGGRAVEMVPAELAQWDLREPQDAPVVTWIRFGTALPDEPRLHRAILGYVSDMSLMRAADVRHGLSWFRGEVVQASLDHMIWFHDDFRADDWLLYVTDSPWAGHGRILTRGTMFRRDGRMVATTTQEALSRKVVRPEG